MSGRWLLAVALVAACVPKPDPDTTRRIAALEQQVTAQQKQLADLKAAQGASPELGAVLDNLENLTERIIKLESARALGAAPVPHRREPDRDVVYAVPVAGSPAYGSPKAPVTLVMAMDFACPYCRRAFDTVDELRKKYGAELRVVYKSMIVHPQVATHAALAACAANHQGKFHELAELLWTKSFDAHDFADATVDAIAREAKLDQARYTRDVAGVCAAEIAEEQRVLTKLGVGATPSFFINGRFMAGAMPIEQFSSLIDEELAKANAAIKAGVKADKYYEQEVVGKGVKELAP